MEMRNVGDDPHVASDEVNGLWVSTVELCIDHGFGGTPLWYETMVFDQKSAQPWSELAMDRYETKAEALAGHAAMCERVRKGEITSEKDGAR